MQLETYELLFLEFFIYHFPWLDMVTENTESKTVDKGGGGLKLPTFWQTFS